MNEKISRIKEAVAEAGGNGEYEILSGTVVSVNESNYQVDIRINGDDDNDSLVLPAILLRAASDDTKAGSVLIPSVGSHVIFCKVEGASDYVLLKTTELDKVITEIGTTKLSITSQGYEITRGEESLKKLLDDLLTAILQLTVTTSTGPSGTPINIAAFQALQQRLPNLLN